MGISFAAVGYCDSLFIRRDLPSDSSFWLAIFYGIASCIQETSVVRLPASL